MQPTDLKYPGGYTHAKTVRREVAHIISQLQIAEANSTIEPFFAQFLADAAAKTPGSTTGAYVANAGTVNVENSAGNLDSPATATVAAGVLTGVKLAATKTILTDATKFSGVTITGSGTFFTPTIVNGVMTGGVLSAS